MPNDLLLNHISLNELKDDELFPLLKEILICYYLDQTEKQKIYDVLYEKRGQREIWSVPYDKFRSVEEIQESQYFTKAERDQIAVDNERLIWEVYHKYKPNDNQDTTFTKEDIYEACCIGFSKALINYNKKNVSTKFSTYAHRCMENQCIEFIRYSLSRGRGDAKILSLDYEYSNSSDGGGSSSNENKQLIDFISEEENKTESVIDASVFKDAVEQLLEGLDDDHTYLAKHLYGILGYEKMQQIDIATELNISKPKLKKMISTVKEHFALRVYELGLRAEDFF